MTESEWLGCTDPTAMLKFLRGKVSDRKFLLFACECCRQIWPLISDGRSRKAVEMMERDVEKPVSEREYNKVFWDAQDATGDEDEQSEQDPAYNAAEAAYSTIPGSPNLEKVYCAIATAEYAAKARLACRQAEQEAQADLLRDIFGNPFRSASVKSGWLTPTITSLATAAYEERILPSGELDAARLAVLADALEDAGCQDTDILGHLRSPGPHVRGCWVVDLLLGKE